MGRPLGLVRQTELRIEGAVGREYFFRCVVGVVVQHKQQIAVCIPVRRVERQRTPGADLGLLDPPLVFLQVAQAVVRLHEIRLELQRAPHAGLSLFNLAHFIQYHTEVEVCNVKCFVQGNTAAQPCLRLLQATAPVQHHAQVGMCQEVVRSQCDGPAKTELGFHQARPVHQRQAQRIHVAAIIRAQAHQPAQRLYLLALLRLQGQRQHLPGQGVVRAAVGQLARRLLQLGETLLIQQAGQSHNVCAGGLGGAGVWCVKCNRHSARGCREQPLEHLVHRVGCQPGAACVLQHLYCLPGLATAYQGIQVTDPVLPVPGCLVARGTKITHTNGSVTPVQGDDAQVVVGVRVARLLLQNRLVGGLRLGELPVPVQLGGLLH